jgi:hypothetical protein
MVCKATDNNNLLLEVRMSMGESHHHKEFMVHIIYLEGVLLHPKEMPPEWPEAGTECQENLCLLIPSSSWRRKFSLIGSCSPTMSMFSCHMYFFSWCWRPGAPNPLRFQINEYIGVLIGYHHRGWSS